MSSIAPLRSRRSQERSTWPARGRAFARLVSVVVMVLCMAVVAGWLFEVEFLLRPGENQVSVKLNVALAFFAIALGNVVSGATARRLLFLFGGVVGIIYLAEYAFDVGLGFDELLVDDWTAGAGQDPGRAAETTALCLIMLSGSALAIEYGRRVLAQWLSGITLIVGMVASFGYLYGTDSFYRVGPYSTMAVYTAVCIVLLSLATWLAVPAGVLQWISFGHDTGARLQRVLVPVAVVLMPTAGWLHLRAENLSWYNRSLGTALLMAFVAVVVVVTGYRVGRTALIMDLERDTLLDEVHRVNAELEDRVRTKAHQLNRQKTKLALFEERDRIARDLHDRVIQRIFAAGLQVASLSRTARKEAAKNADADSPLPASLDLVAIELDMAIRELRNSIFELTSIDDHDNLEQVVRDIASRASRILGFMPRIDVSGQVAGVPGELVAQLASVIQEGLSNVARHARASAVEVAVEASEVHLEVRVTDDGIGLPDPLPRSSGINNLMSRARNLGGTATWTSVAPSGTRVTWRVPRSGHAEDLPPEEIRVPDEPDLPVDETVEV